MTKKNKSTNKAFKLVTRGGGMKIRILHQLYRKKQKAIHKCPDCLKLSFKRIKSGIWGCIKCKIQYTGGAYDLISN